MGQPGSADNARIRAIVHGCVQGVGFRSFVAKHGEALGLSGYARNLSDGTVEVVAEGEKERLKLLIADLERGSRFSRVERVDVEWHEYRGDISGFHIRW